jgi:hypothetical protein
MGQRVSIFLVKARSLSKLGRIKIEYYSSSKTSRRYSSKVREAEGTIRSNSIEIIP